MNKYCCKELENNDFSILNEDGTIDILGCCGILNNIRYCPYCGEDFEVFENQITKAFVESKIIGEPFELKIGEYRERPVFSISEDEC